MEGALIVGAGPGLSASLARRLAAQGRRVVLAARDTAKLAGLCAETGATAIACDATDPEAVAALFAQPGFWTSSCSTPADGYSGPLVGLGPAEVRRALMVSAYGGFLVGQAAARGMLARGGGTILFTGASASVKGYAQSAPFAMGKFALRGLAQSMARELQPRGIHVAHVVVDGAIRNPGRTEPEDAPDSMLDPDAIAETYMQLIAQPRSAWAWEIELRPWVERF